MKTLVAIFRKFAKGPLVADEPKRRDRSLAPIVVSEIETSGISSSERPVVKKSAGDRNWLVAVGFSVVSAGSSAFNGMVSRSSDETSTEIVMLRSATSAMLFAWGTSSGEAIVVCLGALEAACGKANAPLKSVADMIVVRMVEEIGEGAVDSWFRCSYF